MIILHITMFEYIIREFDDIDEPLIYTKNTQRRGRM